MWVLAMARPAGKGLSAGGASMNGIESTYMVASAQRSIQNLTMLLHEAAYIQAQKVRQATL